MTVTFVLNPVGYIRGIAPTLEPTEAWLAKQVMARVRVRIRVGAGVSFRAAVRVKARVGRVAVTAKLIVDPPRPELKESLLDGVNHSVVCVARRAGIATRLLLWIRAA